MDIKNSSTEKKAKSEEITISEEEKDDLECAVCLQPCVHPVCLPCSHIFCFLCVKGVANQSKRCAMCRQEIPADFMDNPNLLRKIEEKEADDNGYQWFYEGRNGWWQYDERTSKDLENAFSSGERVFEVLVAGFLYSVDFDRMVQQRRNDPSRRRRIKRDLASIPKKGVAGLKTSLSQTPPQQSSRNDQSTNSSFLHRTNEEASPPDDESRISDTEQRSEAASDVDYLHLNSDLHRNLYFRIRNELPRGDCQSTSRGLSSGSSRIDTNTTTSFLHSQENSTEEDFSINDEHTSLPAIHSGSSPIDENILTNRIYELTLQNDDNETHFYSLDGTEEYNLPSNNEDL